MDIEEAAVIIADSLKGINPRIRKRKSYRFFKELYEWLKTNPSPDDIMREVFRILNEKQAFGTATNAHYARESMELVLNDE
jgi:hypothetical protein